MSGLCSLELPSWSHLQTSVPFGSDAWQREKAEAVAVSSRRFTRTFTARLVAFPGSFKVLHKYTTVSGIMVPGNMGLAQLSHLS